MNLGYQIPQQCISYENICIVDSGSIVGLDGKPGGPLGFFFEKSRLIPGPGFPFNVFTSHSSFIHGTIIQHLLTNTHPRHLLAVTYHPAMLPAEMVNKLKMGHCSVSIQCMVKSKCLSCNKVQHQMHIIYINNSRSIFTLLSFHVTTRISPIITNK